ncbi:hypothetical protein CBR_g23655 [Chara braunii]|uniref:UspA domain-containing protein n=1 Tax=Chara braunii TaxID=69332 RepID=A0A388L4U6_CHABU|nr:hypothetical protein CBR_g23655 [Chara braunii]|eukprot:GBG77325.1 hypothetical protein CBR_g23655 [Chara braunii]
MGPRKVLIAIDHSAESAYAVRWSLAHCLLQSDEVIVLHVRAPTSVFDRYAEEEADEGDGGKELETHPPSRGEDDHMTTQEKIRKASQTYQEISELETHRLAQPLKDAGKTFSIRVVADDKPKERICAEVDEIGADLLVLGNRGMGFIKRTLLGSTCDYCLQHSHCPVLVVKRPLDYHKEQKMEREKEEEERGRGRGRGGGERAA